MSPAREAQQQSTMKQRKGCWTCKDRKIHCDGKQPTCENCAKARRHCQGYGVRLSWPASGDKKRAITTAQPLSVGRVSRRTGEHMFVHTTGWDIELYRNLLQQTDMQPSRLVRTSPPLWRQPQTHQGKHMDLVHYFHDAAHLCLVTFSPSPALMRDVLIRMALTNDTSSGRALLYALLAVSSLRRNGLQKDAIQFKVAALGALATSARSESLGWHEAAQHVAACMLLCAFEIQLPTEDSGEWLWYVHSATKIIQETRLLDLAGQDEVQQLIDWVSYHYTIARFTARHWRHQAAAVNNADMEGGRSQLKPSELRAANRPRSISPNQPLAIIDLVAETFDTLLDPDDPRSGAAEYKNRVRDLEWRLDNFHTLSSSQGLPEASANDFNHVGIEIFRLATLIYLVRSTEAPGDPPSRNFSEMVDRALAVPLIAPVCRAFFPLFIVGSEARTDEQRLGIIDLLERNRNSGQVRYAEGLRVALQSIWAQQDLHADGERLLNYSRLMNTVISSSPALPSYV